MSRAKSLQALIAYCENTTTCRHSAISKFFGETTKPTCEWACDWCKDAVALVKRKEKGLASEEWCSTQREAGAYAVDGYD
jgi:bloom syndrome protein